LTALRPEESSRKLFNRVPDNCQLRSDGIIWSQGIKATRSSYSSNDIVWLIAFLQDDLKDCA